MSTKPHSPLLARPALLAFALALAGCAAPGPQTPVQHFGELRLHRPAPTADELAPLPSEPRAPPALRPRVAAPPEPSAVLAVSVATAGARITAYLAHAGFALEQRPEDGGARLTATRMGAPSALQGEAVCALEAMRRPDIASTDLIVRLLPTPGGVQVETKAVFVEIDTRILARTLARQTCRSRGVLEAAVRRAAMGG